MNRRPITVLQSRRDAAATCLFAALSLVGSAALCFAAVLMHPPDAAVPLLVIVCIGCPVIGTWDLRAAVATLRHGRRPTNRAAIAQFRRSLARLPEIEHPLGR